METKYFLFKNMKEAEYYFRQMAYYAQGRINRKKERPYTLELIVEKEIKENIIGKILIALGLKKKMYISTDVAVFFKSINSNMRSIRDEDIYYFTDKDEYDVQYLLEKIIKR